MHSNKQVSLQLVSSLATIINWNRKEIMNEVRKTAKHDHSMPELAQFLKGYRETCRWLIESHEAKIRAKNGEVWGA